MLSKCRDITLLSTIFQLLNVFEGTKEVVYVFITQIIYSKVVNDKESLAGRDWLFHKLGVLLTSNYVCFINAS